MSGRNKALFEGRVAIVTGAGKGLGKAYALWLGAQGCAVVVNNRAHPGVPSSAQAVADEIIAAGGRAAAHNGAVDEREAGAEMVDLALSRFGRLDALVCNAGVMPEGPFGELDYEEMARLVSINVMGTLIPLQAAWRHMLKTGHGRIVITGSTVGIYGHPGVAAYGSTRASAVGLARSLTLERPEAVDIGVNVVMPFAYTPMSAESIDQVMGPALAEIIMPDRIAPIVGWLCSDACKHSGRIFHASSLRTSRVGLVESPPVIVDPEDVGRLSDEAFPLSPLFEPVDSATAVTRLLGG